MTTERKHKVIRIKKNMTVWTKEVLPRRMIKAFKLSDNGEIDFDNLHFFSLFDLYKYEIKTYRAQKGFMRKHGYQYPTFLVDVKRTLKKYGVIE